MSACIINIKVGAIACVVSPKVQVQMDTTCALTLFASGFSFFLFLRSVVWEPRNDEPLTHASV